jgi:hypothetical protein
MKDNTKELLQSVEDKILERKPEDKVIQLTFKEFMTIRKNDDLQKRLYFITERRILETGLYAYLDGNIEVRVERH